MLEDALSDDVVEFASDDVRTLKTRTGSVYLFASQHASVTRENLNVT